MSSGAARAIGGIPVALVAGVLGLIVGGLAIVLIGVLLGVAWNLAVGIIDALARELSTRDFTEGWTRSLWDWVTTIGACLVGLFVGFRSYRRVLRHGLRHWWNEPVEKV